MDMYVHKKGAGIIRFHLDTQARLFSNTGHLVSKVASVVLELEEEVARCGTRSH